MEIWTPKDEAIPVYKCNVCGWHFTSDEQKQWQSHVGDCARKNMDKILAKRPKGAIFGPDDVDKEAEAHLKKVGERMLKEGRWELKPEEKVET